MVEGVITKRVGLGKDVRVKEGKNKEKITILGASKINLINLLFINNEILTFTYT